MTPYCKVLTKNVNWNKIKNVFIKTKQTEIVRLKKCPWGTKITKTEIKMNKIYTDIFVYKKLLTQIIIFFYKIKMKIENIKIKTNSKY